MKVLQKLIFTFALVAGMTLAVSAQKEKPPPKPNPPVVTPQPKPPPQKPPSDSNKPKKPVFALFVSKARSDRESA